MSGEARVIVIGGGLVGLATALALTESSPGTPVVVLEKEDRVGRHQSTHNSGVLHAGLHYTPGSSKALLAREGIRLMAEFCQRHGIAHEICGKLVVAVDDEEVPRLRALFARGQENGLQGLRWLGPDEAREWEPHVRCKAAVRVPEEGIVDFAAVCTELERQLQERGVEVLTGAEVRGLARSSDGWIVETARGSQSGRQLVNCAGLHSDRVAEMAGERPGCRIVPFRGEYYRLRQGRDHLIRNLIYPTPDPRFPFLGVHFTRQIHGGVEAGPNAVLALAREGYHKGDIRPSDIAETLAFPGLWRFMRRYPQMVWREVLQSFSRARFASALRRMVPEVDESDLVEGGAGVRAQAMLPSGELVQDFLLVMGPGAVHVLNAPSPAATASLAIGRAIAGRVREQMV